MHDAGAIIDTRLVLLSRVPKDLLRETQNIFSIAFQMIKETLQNRESINLKHEAKDNVLIERHSYKVAMYI